MLRSPPLRRVLDTEDTSSRGRDPAPSAGPRRDRTGSGVRTARDAYWAPRPGTRRIRLRVLLPLRRRCYCCCYFGRRLGLSSWSSFASSDAPVSFGRAVVPDAERWLAARPRSRRGAAVREPAERGHGWERRWGRPDRGTSDGGAAGLWRRRSEGRRTRRPRSAGRAPTAVCRPCSCGRTYTRPRSLGTWRSAAGTEAIAAACRCSVDGLLRPSSRSSQSCPRR